MKPNEKIAKQFYLDPQDISYVRGKGWQWLSPSNQIVFLASSLHELQCSPDWARRCLHDVPMTIPQFARLVQEEHPNLKTCYIAIIPNQERYDLEVEVSLDSIGGVYATDCKCGKSKQEIAVVRVWADRLDEELTKLGIKVYDNRGDWEFSHK
jgi:hypothetical protein